MSRKLLVLVPAVVAVALVGAADRASADDVIWRTSPVALPDLAISSLTPITVTVRNEPVNFYRPTATAGAFRVDVVRYHIECWYAYCRSVADQVRTFEVSSLAAGVSVSLTYGSYSDPYLSDRVAVYVDALNQVAERDETNNTVPVRLGP
jgi:hypothetical protein